MKEATVKVPMGKFKDLAKTIAVGTIEKSPERKVMGYLQAMGKKVRLERDPNSRSGFRVVIEKSVSKSQQRFMGMVRAVQKGDMKAPSPEVAKAAKSMKKKDVKDFASTKHKGLPEMKTFREMREGAMSKDKEKHDTGGFRISNADAKAARDRIMQKKQKSASQNKSFNKVRSRMEDNIDELSTALANRAAKKADAEYDHYKKKKDGAMAYHRGSQARSFKHYAKSGEYHSADR